MVSCQDALQDQHCLCAVRGWEVLDVVQAGSLAVIPRAEHHHHSSPSSLPLGCSRAGAAGGRKGTGAPDAALPSLPRLRGSCNTFHFAIPFFVFFLLLLFFPCASVVSPAAVLFLQVKRGSVGITCPGNAASLGG